jgi:hypothetical protein
MDETADPPSDDVEWRRRLQENRATMQRLRQDTARVSGAIAETERAVASTLRRLAQGDRERGRTGAADRRDAHAHDAERFAAQESAAAGELAAPAPLSPERPPLPEPVTPVMAGRPARSPSDRPCVVGSSRAHTGP